MLSVPDKPEASEHTSTHSGTGDSRKCITHEAVNKSNNGDDSREDRSSMLLKVVGILSVIIARVLLFKKFPVNLLRRDSNEWYLHQSRLQ